MKIWDVIPGLLCSLQLARTKNLPKSGIHVDTTMLTSLLARRHTLGKFLWDSLGFRKFGAVFFGGNLNFWGPPRCSGVLARLSQQAESILRGAHSFRRGASKDHPHRFGITRPWWDQWYPISHNMIFFHNKKSCQISNLDMTFLYIFSMGCFWFPTRKWDTSSKEVAILMYGIGKTDGFAFSWVLVTSLCCRKAFIIGQPTFGVGQVAHAIYQLREILSNQRFFISKQQHL